MNKTTRTFLNVLVGSTYCRHRMQITSWGIFLKTLTRLKAGVLFYECCSSFKSLLSASVQEPGCRRRGKDALTFARSNVCGRTLSTQHLQKHPDEKVAAGRRVKGETLLEAASSNTHPSPAGAIAAVNMHEAPATVGHQRRCRLLMTQLITSIKRLIKRNQRRRNHLT